MIAEHIRNAIAALLTTDKGSTDEERTADFAKKCGIKNEDFTAITQARASLEEFYKEHSDLKPSEE